MWFSKQAESPACIATENRIAEALQSLILLVQSAFSMAKALPDSPGLYITPLVVPTSSLVSDCLQYTKVH